MPNFAIRVELRGYPTREQYDALHALMARKGFLQNIAGVDSQGNHKQVALPHAVYFGASTASCTAVPGRSGERCAVSSPKRRNCFRGTSGNMGT
jgi:hypothetical protein